MHNFKKLHAWNASIEMVTDVYKFTETFPKTEIYGLTNQMRRCAVSISSNIAEGAGRSSNPQFRVFLGYAYGSSCELETQMIIANKLNFLNSETLERLSASLSEIQKMIFKLSQSLKDETKK